MAVEDFFGESEGTLETVADYVQIVLDALVVDVCVGLEQGHGNLCVANAGCGGSHALREHLGRACPRGGIEGKHGR